MTIGMQAQRVNAIAERDDKFMLATAREYDALIAGIAAHDAAARFFGTEYDNGIEPTDLESRQITDIAIVYGVHSDIAYGFNGSIFSVYQHFYNRAWRSMEITENGTSFSGDVINA